MHRACMDAYIHTHAHAHTHAHTQTHTQTHIHIRIHTCIHRCCSCDILMGTSDLFDMHTQNQRAADSKAEGIHIIL